MCEYQDLTKGECKITKEICPYLYFCNKYQAYRPSRYMPENCKVAENFKVPKGFYKVSYEKRGQLYVSVNGYIEIVANPYDYIPSYVKMTKLKSGKWKIREAMG